MFNIWSNVIVSLKDGSYWCLHSGSKKASDAMLRLRSAWVNKREADWFEFTFRNDPDPAHPGTHTYFTIVLCRD